MGQIFDKGWIKYELVFSEILGLNRLAVKLKSTKKKNRSLLSGDYYILFKILFILINSIPEREAKRTTIHPSFLHH